MVLVIAPSKNLKTLQELIAAAKAKPGTFTYGAAGIGTPPHLTMERFRVAAGFDGQLIPFKGAPEALTEVMTGRDLNDPATARALADRVGTIERLKYLTVLTYADISAVNPGAMTPWRLEQLWRVYRIAQQELLRELETGRIDVIPEHLATHGDFVRGFPTRYLRTHSNEEIAAHLKLYEASRPTGVAANIDRADGFFRLTVIARDMPALFASFAGALSSFGVDILKAEAFSNAKGLILDTFVFSDPKRNLELNPSEVERLVELIKKVATGKTDVQRLLKSRPQDAKRKSEIGRAHV